MNCCLGFFIVCLCQLRFNVEWGFSNGLVSLSRNSFVQSAIPTINISKFPFYYNICMIIFILNCCMF